MYEPYIYIYRYIYVYIKRLFLIPNHMADLAYQVFKSGCKTAILIYLRPTDTLRPYVLRVTSVKAKQHTSTQNHCIVYNGI